MADGGFDFQKFIEDSKATLMAPKEYFAAMAKEGGFVEPLVKAVIYGLLAGIITFIWSLLHLTAAAGMFGGMVGGGTIGYMAIVGAIIFSVIGLFVGGVIMLLISAICGGNTDYEANVRVVASTMVLSPVNALLGFTGAFGLWLSTVIGLGVSLYGIWLTYNALLHALKAKEGTVKIISGILAAILILLSIGGMVCKRSIGKVGDKYMKDNQKTEEALKQWQKEMEKMKDQQK